MKGQYSFDNYSSNQEQNRPVPFSDVNELKMLKNKKNIETITLQEWLDNFHTQEDLQTLFVNMDIAMKYVHHQGYYINSFALDKIEILNHSLRQVKFDSLEDLPGNFQEDKALIRNNIFYSAVLQIGVYANCLPYFNGEAINFLKHNLDNFSIFLPQEDLSYFKGVIERDASVYYSDYVGERKKRDLANLDREVSEGGNGHGKSLVKTNGTFQASDLVPNNDKENELIYANLLKKDGAFVRSLIYPILVLTLGLTILLLSYILY